MRNHVDDEYQTDKYTEPYIMMTTSRNPSSRLLQFQKEVNLLFPNAIRFNRGNYKIKDLIETSEKKGFTDIVLVHEHRGEPDGIIVCHMPIGPTMYFGIQNAVLRHDLDTKAAPVSEAAPHLIFDNMNSNLGERVKTILKSLFPIPKPDTKRILTFANHGDLISFRHHNFNKPEYNKVDLEEVGPRFDLKPYMIKLGTLMHKEAAIEWVLRPYMNSAKNQNYLSREP